MGASIRKAILVILFVSTLTACGVGGRDGEIREYIDFAYVTNQYSGAIHGFKISETGELISIHTSLSSPGDPPIIYFAITPNGKFLYTAGSMDSVFKIDASTGSLTWRADPPLLGEALSMYIDPSGRFLFDNWSSSGEYVTIKGLRVLRINQEDGSLTAAAGHGPAYTDGSVAFDPEGKFAYMSSEWLGLSVYAIDGETGDLLEIPGSPYPVSYDSGSDPSNVVVVHPQSGLIYIASTAGISVFALDAVSGALMESEGSPFAPGDSPRTLAIDPSGRFAYAVSWRPALLAYAIDPATGALSEVEGSPYTLPAAARSLAIAPSGRSLYATIPEANAVRAYAINNDSGALAPIGGSPVQAGTSPRWIATIRIRQGA